MLSRLARATVARGGLKRGNVWCVVVKTWFMSPDFIFISTIKWSGSAVPLQAYTVALCRLEGLSERIAELLHLLAASLLKELRG